MVYSHQLLHTSTYLCFLNCKQQVPTRYVISLVNHRSQKICLQYLERRFGKASRLAASLSYSLQMTLYMGVVLYAPALALEALTGISKVTAILSVGLVCTFYSTIGGMKAVLMTDVFQSILMFAAVFSVIIYAVIDKGSFANIWEIAQLGNRTELLK
jgi:sodium-coupled monocarboxylate transporter 8/12